MDDVKEFAFFSGEFARFFVLGERGGNMLRFPRGRLQLTCKRRALLQVDLQLVLVPQESPHIPSARVKVLHRLSLQR